MTGFFMANGDGRLEVQYNDDGDTRGVIIDLANSEFPDSPWILIDSEEELGDLIEYLNDCKDKLKFHKK